MGECVVPRQFGKCQLAMAERTDTAPRIGLSMCFGWEFLFAGKLFILLLGIIR